MPGWLTPAKHWARNLVHDRMPLIVAPEDAPRWLDRDEHDVQDLLRPYPAEEMDAYPAGPAINSSKNDGPELIEPMS